MSIGSSITANTRTNINSHECSYYCYSSTVVIISIFVVALVMPQGILTLEMTASARLPVGLWGRGKCARPVGGFLKHFGIHARCRAYIWGLGTFKIQGPLMASNINEDKDAKSVPHL